MKFLFLCVFPLLGTTVQGINNGLLTFPHQYKYVVSIHTKILNTCTISTCTGSIIHERFIVTAAHCFTSISSENSDGSNRHKFDGWPVTVYANTSTLNSDAHAIERRAKRVYLKSRWLETGIDADIAILELDEKLVFEGNEEFLEKIDLPEKKICGSSQPKYKTYADKGALFTGYGEDIVGPKDTKNKLKRMYIKMIDYFYCKRAYTGSEFLDDDRVLCGNAVEKVCRNGREEYRKPSVESGPCEGDSGGPLVYKGKTLIGVLTRGSENCDDRDKYPGVYMRVSHYMDFIEAVLTNKVEEDSDDIKYLDLTTKNIVENVIDRCKQIFTTKPRPLNNRPL